MASRTALLALLTLLGVVSVVVASRVGKSTAANGKSILTTSRHSSWNRRYIYKNRFVHRSPSVHRRIVFRRRPHVTPRRPVFVSPIVTVTPGRSCAGVYARCTTGFTCLTRGTGRVCIRVVPGMGVCGAAHTICAARTHCVGPAGGLKRCRMPVGLGRACDISYRRCIHGLTCSGLGAGMFCRNKARAGAACGMFTLCPTGYHCAGSRCVKRVTTIAGGGVCGQPGTRCVAGFECSGLPGFQRCENFKPGSKGAIADFGRGFFRVPKTKLAPRFRHQANTQFHNFLQFNERPRPHNWPGDLHRRFPRRCRSFPRRTRTIDGFCNNRAHRSLGMAGRPFRLEAAIPLSMDMSGNGRPNPRVISNTISVSHDETAGNKRRLAEMVTFFGQFLDHTVTETENEKESAPIPVPANDTAFNGGAIPFFRTRKERTSRGYSPLNLLPSFIDAASVYGPTDARARELREFRGGRLLRSSGNLLSKASDGFFRSGDRRANENPMLTALHTLFFREHNRVCAELAARFHYMNDELLYQSARKIVGAQLQAIVYYEYLPAMMGRRIAPYTGYSPRVDPRISNEFSTVAFRVGHTLINKFITAVDTHGRQTQVRLRDAFFAPESFSRLGMDSLLRGAVQTQAAEIDVQITGEVRNFLLASATDSLRLDLASLNIQRGRDHAIPDYNTLRRTYGLWPVRQFYEITSNPELAARLERLYKSVDQIDAWVGGLAEDHVPGSSLGPLFQRIWGREFTRLRDGDRLYYERRRFFPSSWWRSVPTVQRLLTFRKGGVLKRIITDNTGIRTHDINHNPFMVL